MNIATKAQVDAYKNFRRGLELVEERERLKVAAGGVSGAVIAIRIKSNRAALTMLSTMMNEIRNAMSENSLLVDNSDRAFELEATLYAYMKASNKEFAHGRVASMEAMERIGANGAV